MKILFFVASKLPLRGLYFLADIMYLITYYLIRYRRSVVSGNIAGAYPEKTPTEQKTLGKQFYRHLCNVLVEVAKSPALDAEEMQQRVTFTNLDILQPYVDQQQPLLFLAAHQGNWEWVLQVLSLALPFPFDAIYKPLHNSEADTVFRGLRTRFGASLIPASKAIKTILKRRGEMRGFMMAADQAPIRRDKKYWHDFMGREAAFYLGPQVIAEMTRYPVFFIKIQRRSRGYYEVTFEPLTTPPYPKNSHEVLNSYIAATERAIKGQPETWLWSNRKWRRTRVDDKPAS